ncbi:MAG: hypothetical protein IT289_12440 [Oligoflexia bacterium]|nr:hypothetical protein [Oligoflexia bacterium]
MAKKTREARPGELREIAILETLERYARKPEARLDVQKILDQLSPTGKKYVQHLVMSGPSSIVSAAKALELKQAEVEAAIAEIELALSRLK